MPNVLGYVSVLFCTVCANDDCVIDVVNYLDLSMTLVCGPSCFRWTGCFVGNVGLGYSVD